MLEVTKAAILTEHDVSFTSSAVALVGALIVVKSILLLEGTKLAEFFSARPIVNLLWKALLFLAVATVFRALEELLHATRRTGSLKLGGSEMLAVFSETHFLLLELWLLCFLLLYCLLAYLAGTIGHGALWRQLTGGSGRR